MTRQLDIIALAVILALLATGIWALAARQGPVVLGEYSTSLQGRTEGQRHNADMAARRIDGVTIPSGRSFSFNGAVGPWTSDMGYLRAPVSYDGELVPAWGGGVCQTSTTLYNAALLAGLEIRQRHRHAWAPLYVAPGRDAAVAYPTIDLVLRNPHPWPVQISAETTEDALRVSVSGDEALPYTIAVTEEVRSTVPPTTIIQQALSGRHRVLNTGQTGFDVAVYRTHRQGDMLFRRELVSSDRYPAMNRLVGIGR